MFQRLERVEERRARWQRPVEQISTLHQAIAIGFALRVGGNAKEELDKAGTSLDPERRAELTKQLEGARKIAKVLAKSRPAEETPPSARHLIPERLGGRHEVR